MPLHDVRSQQHGRMKILVEQVSATDNPMNVVKEYVSAFNRGDIKTMAGRFTVPAFILDGLAPHVWHGATAGIDWYRDVLAAAEHEGARDYFVSLGTPLHASITGDSAYIVIPANMTFKLRGRQIAQSGAILTVALRKLADSWRIAAWAWSKGTVRN